jgi:DNA-binding NtrC family response regulator
VARAAEVLVAFSDPQKGRMLASLLRRYGLRPVFSSTLAELRTLLEKRPIAMLFCEDVLSDGNFAGVLCEVERPGSKLPVIMFSHQNGWKRYLEAMRYGAFDDIVTPYRSVGLCATPGARPLSYRRNVAARTSRGAPGESNGNGARSSPHGRTALEVKR